MTRETSPQPHVFSTLITAQEVRDLLGTDEGITDAISWCEQTGVTKVYIETFRTGYLADRKALVRVKRAFVDAGIVVSGCVTTTGVGKQSTGWELLACYTDPATQDRLAEIFAFTAELFDEIMIDDFWFTDCECAECNRARRSRTVTVGETIYAVEGDGWSDYRCELMVHLSRERIIPAARRANPNVKLIIKFPEWYDRFQYNGYEIVRETLDFDRIWVGTETRDYDDEEYGGRPQYQAYFVMRWLSRFGGDKCGGGWYDPYGTGEQSYVEQARQTVLAGADESLLFCYGSLLEHTGPANVAAFRECIPELQHVAQEVGKREPVGIAAYKPPNSDGGAADWHVFDFVGMMGLPLVPCHEFPTDATAAFFSVHALKDPDFPDRLAGLIANDVPVLLTATLRDRLMGTVDLDPPNVYVLPTGDSPKSLLELSQDELDAIRLPLLAPFGRTFASPNRVALYLFDDGSWVIENFGDEPATVALDEIQIDVPARGWCYEWRM
jgi:hypothetical protein